ncbi:hypothetical protein, partial [Bartonella bovis]|uniref:hypothetical protein n=1 Tax=Bartonella bovis TaxID=155194 RepID=UPI001304D93F
VKMGVYAMEAKTMTISGGSISEVQTGITMSGSGKLVVNNKARIEFTSGGTRNYGIGVGNGVTANITGAEITGGGQGTGVYATGAKAVTMEEVRISNVAMGVEVKGGILAMKGGSIGFTGDYGISLKEGGAALKDVNITGQGHETEVAVKAVMGTVAIKGGEMSNVGTGVEVKSEGAVWLVDTKLRGVYKGVSVEDGVVHMEGGEIG